MPKKYTYENVKFYIESESQSGCKLVSTNYNGNKSPLIVLCSNCKDEYPVSFEHFKSNKKYRCNKCVGKARYNIHEIKEIVLSESKCKLLSDKYINNTSSIILECECLNVFITSLKKFRKGKKQCEECTNKCLSEMFSKKDEVFKKEIHETLGDDYLVKSRYENVNTKVQIKHLSCGRSWWANPGDLLYKLSRCPYCNSSKGEREVTRILCEHNIDFLTQKKFNGCKNKRELPFDFYIDNYADTCQPFILEYDGSQHFDMKFGVGQSEHMNLVKNDKIKNKFCIDNNILLFRIPYWEFDNIDIVINNILEYCKDVNYMRVDENQVKKYLVNQLDWSYRKYISEASCNIMKDLVSV